MDAIGDTLLSLPALHILRRFRPDSRIVVAASVAGAAVLQDDPAGFEVAVVEDPRKFVPPPADVALSFTEKPWGYRWMVQSGARIRIGFWPGRSQPFKSLQIAGAVTHRIAQQQDPTVDQGIHEVERYMRLIEPLGCSLDAPPMAMYVPAAAHAAVAAWLADGGIGDFVVLHLSQKWLAGGWRLEFLRKLAARIPHCLVAFGPAEQSWAAQVAAPRRWFDPDLKRYAALLSRARALVTMDTSAAHLAAAVGTPLVDVFPPRNFVHNTTRWRPWKVPHILLKKHEPCTGDVVSVEDALVDEILKALEQLPCRSASA
jgi:ADP-heptose:LPS heptosyltransferase